MKDTHIEDLFRNAFGSTEIKPPSDLWGAIEGSLNDSNVDVLYAESFKNAKIIPSNSVWKKISRSLFLTGFLQFKVQSFNVYYAALSAVVGGVIGYSLLSDKTHAPIQYIEHTIQEIHYSPAILLEAPDALFAIESDGYSAEIISNKTDLIESPVCLKTEIMRPVVITDKKNTVEASKLQLMHAYFEGNPLVCANLDAEYTLKGVPSEYNITWEIDKKVFATQNVRGNKIIVNWSKAGTHTIQAKISHENATAYLEYPVTVEEAKIPIVKGNAIVCEGEKNMLYQIDEPVNKDLRYIWLAKHNKIEMTGNKYVNIDWVKSGKDTLSIIRIDNKTGCKSQGDFIVSILPKPTVDFSFAPLGDGNFQFAYVGPTQRGMTFLWNIEGVEYNKKNVEHMSSNIGGSVVTLTVTDRHKCSNMLQKDVPFNKYLIQVPRIISFDKNNFSHHGFIPLTNTPLEKYKVEIFNANNNKIWESTMLENGKPAEAWNGTHKGEPISQGRYYWRISAVFTDGVEWQGIPQSNGECKPNGIVQVLEN